MYFLFFLSQPWLSEKSFIGVRLVLDARSCVADPYTITLVFLIIWMQNPHHTSGPSPSECCLYVCVHTICAFILLICFFFFYGEWSFCWQRSSIKSRDGEEREPCNWTTVPFIICSRKPFDHSLRKYQLFGLVRLRLGLHLDQRVHASCIMDLIFHSSSLSGCEWSAGCVNERCHQTHADAEPRGETHTTPVRRLAPRQTEFVPVE